MPVCSRAPAPEPLASSTLKAGPLGPAFLAPEFALSTAERKSFHSRATAVAGHGKCYLGRMIAVRSFPWSAGRRSLALALAVVTLASGLQAGERAAVAVVRDAPWSPGDFARE